MTFDTAAMVAELTRDEGVRLRVYDDATGEPLTPGKLLIGHPTIGVGRALDVNGISQAESDAMLESDIEHYIGELMGYAWFLTMDPVRQRAVVNMRHQLGLHGLLGFSKMIAAIERQDWADAFAEGHNSAWYRQTPWRAERVLLQLRDGVVTA